MSLGGGDNSSLACASRTSFLLMPAAIVCRRLSFIRVLNILMVRMNSQISIIILFCSFLCLSKETKQRKDTTPKDTAILLSHRANHTNCHAKFCVRAGRGLPTHVIKRVCLITTFNLRPDVSAAGGTGFNLPPIYLTLSR